MSIFSFKPLKHILSNSVSDSFESVDVFDDTAEDCPYWEIQRNEALEVITSLYLLWDKSWSDTKTALGVLQLSESGLRRLNFYESEQKKSIISALAKLLVAWETNDQSAFSTAVLILAREFRPSLPYVEYEPNENFTLNSSQLSLLRYYLRAIADIFKTSISDLQTLSQNKIDFNTNALSESAAESLIRDQLGLSFFDFIDFGDDPKFNSGYYPELLQLSAEFNL